MLDLGGFVNGVCCGVCLHRFFQEVWVVLFNDVVFVCVSNIVCHCWDGFPRLYCLSKVLHWCWFGLSMLL